MARTELVYYLYSSHQHQKTPVSVSLFYVVLYTVVLALTYAVQKDQDSNKFWQCCIIFVTCCFQMILLVETSMVVLSCVADFCQHSRGEKLASESRDPPLVSIPKSCRILLNNHSLSPADFQCQSSPSNPTDKGGGGRRPVKQRRQLRSGKKRNESLEVQRSLASLRSWSGEPPWSLKHLSWSHMRAYMMPWINLQCECQSPIYRYCFSFHSIQDGIRCVSSDFWILNFQNGRFLQPIQQVVMESAKSDVTAANRCSLQIIDLIVLVDCVRI